MELALCDPQDVVGVYVVNSYYTKISFRNIADNAYDTKAYDIAVKYYKQLADLGEKDALIRLSDIYISEDKGFTNKELAVDILKKLANEGVAEAQSRLGILYFESSQDKRTCIEHDYVKAFNWLSKATNSSKALKAISLMYKYGHCVEALLLLHLKLMRELLKQLINLLLYLKRMSILQIRIE